MQKLIYPELSYKLVGLAYKIDNSIGFGHPEKVYSEALEELLSKENLNFEKEYYCPLKVDDKVIAKRYFDFFVEEKVIIEVKVGDYHYKKACDQIFQYLKESGLKLGIIIRFTKDGVKVKRIPCFY